MYVEACRSLLHQTTIVRARRPINAAVVGSVRLVVAASRTVESRQAKAVFVALCSGVARLGVARLGVSSLSTTPVQARFPIDAGGVGSILFRYGVARRGPAGWGPVIRGKVRFGTTLVQARGWINASGVGWVPARRCSAWSGAARHGLLMFGEFRNHHAVGAVPASTPVGGIGLVTARSGKARRGESRHGMENAALATGATAASTRRGGMHQGKLGCGMAGSVLFCSGLAGFLKAWAPMGHELERHGCLLVG